MSACSASDGRGRRISSHSGGTIGRGPGSPAVNHLFCDEFGDEYQPLAASAEFADPVFGHPVELLVTEKTSYRDTAEHWRRGEARRIASRAGARGRRRGAPGEIVVLFAAGTDAERYEEALRREGLPTYRAAGRGYFGQQQATDLLAYMRLVTTATTTSR